MELVSPAGNLEKLEYAYLFGADAAYIGIKNFSLRAQAENFKKEEYNTIKNIKKKKKLYGALNIYFHDHDIGLLKKEIEYISKYPFDAPVSVKYVETLTLLLWNKKYVEIFIPLIPVPLFLSLTHP